jgi:hypothetical protein
MKPREQERVVLAHEQATIVRFLSETIRITPEEVVRYWAGARYKKNPRVHRLVSATIKQANHLAAPVLIYALHGVKTLDHRGKLILENGRCLKLPPMERHPDTRYLASCVCSLGAVLETICRRLGQRGQIFQAMLLDAAGVSLLDALVNKSHEQLCQWALEMQLYAGCPFGPGYRDMPMETQSLLFQLVDAHAIQVELNKSLMMHPMKSLSFFVRLSESENPNGPTPKCRHCNLKHCQFRVDDESPAESTRLKLRTAG